MLRNKWVFRLAIPVLFGACGCTVYEGSAPIIKVANFYEFRQTVGDLTVIADPYEEKDKVENIFGTDVRAHGVLPLHLIVENKGKNEYDLAKVSITLIDDRSQQAVALISPEEVAERAKFNVTSRVLGYAALGSALLFFTVPFAVSAGVSTTSANKRLAEDYDHRGMLETIVGRREVADGFLFFDLPVDKVRADRMLDRPYTFRLENVLNKTAGERLDFSISIQPKRKTYV